LPQVVRFETGDFRSAPPDPADLVLANLTGGMLRTTAGTLQLLLRAGGELIVSGFDESEEAAVRAGFASLRIAERLEEATWVAIRFEQNPTNLT
jgi:ribosomal protein L11 methylase PrmA